jgi:hypothetical protein
MKDDDRIMTKPPTHHELVESIRKYFASKGHPILEDMTEEDIFFMWSESPDGDVDTIIADSDL